MAFLLLIFAGIGFVALVLGTVAAAVVLPCSNVSSGLGRFGIVVACLGSSLFAVATLALVLFMIAFGLSDM